MKLSRRLMTLLLMGLSLVTVVVTWREVRTEQLVQQIGLQERAERLAERLQELLEPALRYGSVDQIGNLTEGLSTNEHIVGAAIYDMEGRPLAISAFAKAPDGRPGTKSRCGSPDIACGAPNRRNHSTVVRPSASSRRCTTG